MGFSFKKVLPKSVNKAIGKAGGGTKLLSYVAPYTLLASSGGRANLQKTYGPFAQLASGVMGGGAGAGVFAAASESGLFGGEPESEAQSAQVYSDSAPSGPAGGFGGAATQSRNRMLLIVAGVVVVGVAAILLLRK